MRKRLGGKRTPKHVTLSEYAIGIVAEFGRRHDLNFSQAIEYLALIGLQDTKTTGQAELLATVVRHEMAHSFNRFAKLIVYAGLEAGAAKHAAQSLFFLRLLDLAEEVEDPSQLKAQLSVDPETALGKEIIRLYKQREGRFRWRAVKGLKLPIAELHEVLAELDGNGAGAGMHMETADGGGAEAGVADGAGTAEDAP